MIDRHKGEEHTGKGLPHRRRAATLVVMRETWFLKLDGIAGESADDRHADEIEIHSWSWGVATPPARAVPGAAASPSSTTSR